jgi:hypothetical protein
MATMAAAAGTVGMVGMVGMVGTVSAAGVTGRSPATSSTEFVAARQPSTVAGALLSLTPRGSPIPAPACRSQAPSRRGAR